LSYIKVTINLFINNSAISNSTQTSSQELWNFKMLIVKMLDHGDLRYNCIWMCLFMIVYFTIKLKYLVRHCNKNNLYLKVSNYFITCMSYEWRQNQHTYMLLKNVYMKFSFSIYHTPVPILRIRKYGIARPCIYFDVTSIALYKHSVKSAKC
jgi:hypothetical protein